MNINDYELNYLCRLATYGFVLALAPLAALLLLPKKAVALRVVHLQEINIADSVRKAWLHALAEAKVSGQHNTNQYQKGADINVKEDTRMFSQIPDIDIAMIRDQEEGEAPNGIRVLSGSLNWMQRDYNGNELTWMQALNERAWMRFPNAIWLDLQKGSELFFKGTGYKDTLQLNLIGTVHVCCQPHNVLTLATSNDIQVNASYACFDVAEVKGIIMVTVYNNKATIVTKQDVIEVHKNECVIYNSTNGEIQRFNYKNSEISRISID